MRQYALRVAAQPSRLSQLAPCNGWLLCCEALTATGKQILTAKPPFVA